uniref:hypothetical protein n=1 Tax=Salmonella enterica TaxID=28901 RepID=UPI001F5E47BC|nr:hypothetical protein [Salmonella enterica]
MPTIILCKRANPVPGNIISVDMDEYKNIYVISQKHTGLGRFKLCINTYRIDGREMAETEVVPIDMPDSNGEMTWQAKNSHSIRPTYEDYLLEIAYWQMAYKLLNHSDLRLYARSRP